jgi:hypothetical protein
VATALDALLSDDDSSLLPAKNFPLFAALKPLLLDFAVNGSLAIPSMICPVAMETVYRDLYKSCAPIILNLGMSRNR